jgi:hypothetical protein
MMSAPNNAQVQALIQQVTALVNSGRAGEAIAPLRQITELAPRWTVGWLELGGLLLRSNQPADALGALNSAIMTAPQDPAVYLATAQANTFLRNSQRALLHLKQALTLMPALQPALIQAAELEHGKVDKLQARKLAARALVAAPLTFSALAIQLEAAADAADYAATMRLARKLAVTAPGAPNAYRRFALAASASRQLDQVSHYLSWTCTLAPKWADAHLTAAGALFNEAAFPAAATSALSALQLGADALESRLLAARSLLASDRPAEAEVHFNAVVEISPDHAFEAQVARLLITSNDFGAEG